MRKVVIILALLAMGVGALVFYLNLDSWSEERISSTLVARGMPVPMADCMAGRMVERLSPAQLAKLRRLEPQEGEAQVPMSVAELLERLRRVDDPEVIEVTGTAAAVCAFTAR